MPIWRFMKESECYPGKKIGRLTLIEKIRIPDPRKDSPNRTLGGYHCRCECGNEVDRPTSKMKKTSSCGCWKKEQLERLHKSNVKDITDVSDGNKKSPWHVLYQKFQNMHTRIENPNYGQFENYGGRGITICDEWQNYDNFKDWAVNVAGFDLNKPSRSQTLDRIDVNGNYEPSNCRLVDMYVQANNKTDNILLERNGVVKTAAQWTDELNVGRSTLYRRLNEGWLGDDWGSDPLSPEEYGRNIIKFDFRGVETTFRKLSEQYGIGISTLKNRYNKGWRGDKLVSTPGTNIMTIKIDGEVMSISKAAKLLKLTPQAVREHAYKGKYEITTDPRPYKLPA